MIASVSSCSAYRRLVDVFSNLTADVHGQYSVARLEELYEYETKTPVWRVLLVCGLTPALAVILIVLTDTMPLHDPTHGLRHSHLLWLRAFITIFFISGPSLVQLRFIIPNLKITRLDIAVLTSVSSAAAVAAQFAFAHIIGYPVPFALVVGTPACLFVLVSGIFLPRRELLKSKLRLRQQLQDFVNMWICQISLTVVYPVYAYVFKQLSPRAQTAFVLLLPVMKILNKRWLYHSLRDADDLKPEIAVFNVEVFNALYVAVCMQSSRSMYTTIAFMVIDFLQAFHSTYKVTNLLNEVQQLVDDTREHVLSKRPSGVLVVAVATVKGDAQLRKNFRGRSHFVDANAMKKRGSSSTTSGASSHRSIHSPRDLSSSSRRHPN